MKKKLLSLALVLTMALTLLPTAALATHQTTCQLKDEGYKWEVDPNNANVHRQLCSECASIGDTHAPTGDWAQDGTDASKHTRTCGVCQLVESVGHTFGDWTPDENTSKDPGAGGEKVDGQHERTCTVCGAKETGAHTAIQKDGKDQFFCGDGILFPLVNCFPKCSVCDSLFWGEFRQTHIYKDGKCQFCGTAQPSLRPAAAFTSLEMTSATQTELKVSLTNISKAMTLKAILTDSTTFPGDNPGHIASTPVEVAANAASATFTFTDVPAASYYITVSPTAQGQPNLYSELADPENPPAPHTLKAYQAPSTPDKPTTPDKPSTDSQGIPVASEVKSPAQAEAAVNTLKNTGAAVLQDRLMKSASAITSFKALDDAVQSASGIHVTKSVTASAPSVVLTHAVTVTGAAFNAPAGASVSLVLSAPSRTYDAVAGYQVGMTLTGVHDPIRLDVPVIITLPLPSDLDAETVTVLHYHGGVTTPETITPAVSSDTILFTVTGFSDFVITGQRKTSTGGSSGGQQRPDGSAGGDPAASASGGWQYLGGGAGRNPYSASLDAAMPAILSVLNGTSLFPDVHATHWAVNEIRWARDNGLMNGYESGNFRPWAATTRQQFWMILARLAGTRPADMAAAREWAMSAGVSDGTNPHGALSRQQLVAMLYRFAKSQGADVSASAGLGRYADSAVVAPYAKEALSWAVAKNIVGGDSKGNLNPEGTATRAHFAVFLYRFDRAR